VRGVMGQVTGPMPMDSPRRRRRARRQLARALQRLADRASELDVTVWRIQPVVEVCGAGHYVAWRAARSRAWKRDGSAWTTNTWPERLHEPQTAAVLLPQVPRRALAWAACRDRDAAVCERDGEDRA
jgi:hypothetical protein